MGWSGACPGRSGIGLLAPLTLCQIALFSVFSLFRSTSLKSILADCAAKGADVVLVSVRDCAGISALKGVWFGWLVKALSMGIAEASNWVSGGTPVMSSIVRSMDTVL